jgi:hypothetical protein
MFHPCRPTIVTTKAHASQKSALGSQLVILPGRGGATEGAAVRCPAGSVVVMALRCVS